MTEEQIKRMQAIRERVGEVQAEIAALRAEIRLDGITGRADWKVTARRAEALDLADRYMDQAHTYICVASANEGAA